MPESVSLWTTSRFLEPPPDAAGRISQSLAGRRARDVAQGLLVGLTGCTWHVAEATLITAAARRDIPVPALAALLIETVEGMANGDGTDDAETFVSELENLARRPHHPDRPREPGTAAGLWLTGATAVLAVSPIVAGDLRGVIVEGELDLATVPTFLAVVADLDQGAPGAGDVFLLNLAALTFLDASGIRAFQELSTATARRGIALRVARPVARSPRRLLRLAVGNRWLPPSFDAAAETER